MVWISLLFIIFSNDPMISWLPRPGLAGSHSEEVAPSWGSEAHLAADCLWDLEQVPHHLVPCLLQPCEVGGGGGWGRWATLKAPVCSQTARVHSAGSSRRLQLGISSELARHKHNNPRSEGTVCLLTRCESKQPVALEPACAMQTLHLLHCIWWRPASR